jgi:hypothetical protein
MEQTKGEQTPKYVIERDLPGAGKFAHDRLKEISKSPVATFPTLDVRSNGSKASLQAIRNSTSTLEFFS